MAVFAVYWFYLRNQDEIKSGTAGVPAPPLPAPVVTAPGGNTAEPTPILPLSDPQVSAAIRQRFTAIYNDESLRESIYDQENLREGVFSGLLYRIGIRRALTSSLPSGNPNRVPVIPSSVDTEYTDRLELISELETMDVMDRRRDWSEVQQIWRQASDMGAAAGFSFWPPDLLALLDEGLFFNAGTGDRNKSEEYDSWSKDVKQVAVNLIAANQKAEAAIRARAIQQLLAGGWRLEGFSFN